MNAGAFFTAMVLLAAGVAADSRHVEVDEKTDFASLKTFALRDGRATSRKPEIDSPLTIKSVQDAIRADLSSKGLNETSDHPDLVVTFSVAEEGQRVVTGRGKRDMQATSHSVGTLVIDMTRPGTNMLVWHGTYTDDESTAASLAKNLPKDAKKLLSEYPPKKK